MQAKKIVLLYLCYGMLSKPRLASSRPRPRPRLQNLSLETSRDQDSSLENYITDFDTKLQAVFISVLHSRVTVTAAVNLYRVKHQVFLHLRTVACQGFNFGKYKFNWIYIYAVRNLSHLLSCPFEVQCMAFWVIINPFKSLGAPQSTDISASDKL